MGAIFGELGGDSSAAKVDEGKNYFSNPEMELNAEEELNADFLVSSFDNKKKCCCC